MVLMEPCRSQDHERLAEILQSIDRLHLSYLEMDDCQEKIDHRIKLEDCIRAYLYLVSPKYKFYFTSTYEILLRSTVKDNFHAFKAATAWNAIQMYAGNLLSQPWRQEYHQIKTYCGFYQHQVNGNLTGAEDLFIEMGYKYCGNCVLALDGPICPDRVSGVSKDCLIAFVECQILREIWETLSPNYNVTWLEIFQFRMSNICSTQQVVSAFHAKYQNAQMNGAHRLNMFGLSDDPNTALLINPLMPNTVCSHHYPPIPMAGPYTGYYRPAYQYCGHACNTPSVPFRAHPSCTYAVNGYPLPSGSCGNYLCSPHSSQMSDVKSSSSSVHASKQMQSGHSDWEYVYKALESKGYDKDLGRGDVLNDIRNSNRELSKPDTVMHVTREIPIVMSNANDTPDGAGVPSKSPESSSQENVSIIERPLVKSKYVGEKSKTDSWNCESCTFLNQSTSDICSMCDKSRNKVEDQMEIGGPQCMHCTLVNPKDATSCQGCTESLKGCPTYV